MSQEFTSFARARGLDIANVQGVDRIYRCATFNKPNRKNGAYLLRPDGNGWVIAYDNGGELEWFDNPQSPRPWTEAEKAAWQRKKAAQEADERRKHERAARRTQELIDTARPSTHGYLWRKGFPTMQGLVGEDGALIVPMRNLSTGALQGAQLIRWLSEDMQWEKKYLYGSDPKLAVMRLGPKGQVATILCEGYATGLSIVEACRSMHLTAAVLVCFNDGNVVRVARALEHAPFDRCVFADHDDIIPAEKVKREHGEPYETRGPGELAAIKTGLPYAMAPTLGMDANDWHVKHGVVSLSGLLMQALRRCPA